MDITSTGIRTDLLTVEMRNVGAAEPDAGQEQAAMRVVMGTNRNGESLVNSASKYNVEF